jgi:hypothetical protein
VKGRFSVFQEIGHRSALMDTDSLDFGFWNAECGFSKTNYLSIVGECKMTKDKRC